MEADVQAAFQEMLSYGHTDPTPSLVLSEHETTARLMAATRSLDTAMLFGSLLLNPKYQANCVRLESLVHLAIATPDGGAELSPRKARKCFDDLGTGRCGIREDPIEDVFVNLVVTSCGDFRVLEGTWESGGFYLQRFLDALATTPDETEFRALRASTIGLLKLSDELCTRVSLERYAVGENSPAEHLEQSDLSSDICNQLVFTESDLIRLGTTRSELDAFILTEEWRGKLPSIPIGHSPLQQLPLIEIEGGLAFVLPSATTYAIRMYITRKLIDAGYRDSLVQQLGNAYLRLFKHTPDFGLPRQYPLPFAGSPLKTAECLEEIDPGRYVQKVFILDDFRGVKGSGVSGMNDSLSKHANSVYDSVARARDHARKQPGFRQGLTLIITCGIGRGAALPVPHVGEDWSVEAISSPDLATLGWTRNLDLSKLWKILTAFDRLEHAGIQIFNINGLLNLIGWMKSNDWQVVPHAQVPKDFRLGGLLQLANNFLLDLRVSAALESDRVGIRHPTKGNISCRKNQDSYFEADDALPMYMPEYIEAGEDIPFVYRSAATDWWCVVTGGNHETLYERWLTVKTWLPRIIPAIDKTDSRFPKTVLIAVNFSESIGDGAKQAIPSLTEIRDSISIDRVDSESICLTVGRAFELGQQAPTNISEAALVEKLCTAVLRSANLTVSEQAFRTLQEQIVPNEHARHLHAFHARSFRDYVACELRESPIEIDESDSAALRVGLAFRVESREKGRFTTRSKRQSTRLLNAIVLDLEAELCNLVRQFDRRTLVEMALLNHERGVFSRQRWMRTARANLAIRDDHQNAVEVIAKKDVDASSVIFPSQIIAEIALCEARLTGGVAPGEFDFERMMNLVIAIAQFGGWSDAIYLDTMPPGLVITALGDVQADNQFRSDILMPFSRSQSEHRLANSVEKFAENYEAPRINSSASPLDQRFEDAWEAELGFQTDDVRKFMDCIDDMAIADQKAVQLVTKSELLDVADTPVDVTEKILEAFTLKPRTAWSTVPDGYHAKDVQLWRYRRQLSAIRRPILQIDEQDDPRLLVAPGFIRQCMAYVVQNYFEGTFPARHFRTSAINKWHGFRKNQRGREFTEAVAKELRDHGWTCWTEQKVSTLAECGKNPDYGDVDVVAWNSAQERLLLIECKDLYFGKTAGEIAEQLRDYRGEIRQDGRKQKRDDLRKHLDRLNILNDRRETVCRTLKVDRLAKFEGWTVFKNPVPMLYAWKKFEGIVQIVTFDDLAEVASNRTGKT